MAKTLLKAGKFHSLSASSYPGLNLESYVITVGTQKRDFDKEEKANLWSAILELQLSKTEYPQYVLDHLDEVDTAYKVVTKFLA